MDNYYNITTHVSNSDLGRLQDLINGVDPFNNPNMEQIFAFGSLVDGMLLEPENIVYSERRLINPSGGDIVFDEVTWNKALRMRNAGRNDRLLAMYIESMSKQQMLLVDEFEISYEGYRFLFPARCKYDLCNQAMKMGADLKTTSSSNVKQFIQVIDTLNYDRQAAWYMDLGGLDNFLFICIAKEPDKKGNHNVFHVAMERDSELYVSGRRKYEKLAYLYNLLIL